MSCDCDPQSKTTPSGQHAVRWLAWYIGTPDPTEYDCRSGQRFDALPDDGVLGIKVFFSDGTSRMCAGDDWYGMLRTPDGAWTVIHNSHPEAENRRRYPDVVWKRGRWTSEAAMQAVTAALIAAE